VVLLRVTTVNLTAVDVKDINKNYVNSASSQDVKMAKSRSSTCPIEVNRVQILKRG